jgi:RNA polymerase sigma-70 factor (ECF subfamily)
MTSKRERELVERLRHQDAEALGPYLELRRHHLMAYIDRRMGPNLRSKVEPEDIFQEVAASALRALPTYTLGDRDPFGWLCTLADRRIVDAHRRYFGAEKRSADREVRASPTSDEGGQAGLIDLLVASLTTASMVFSRNARAERLFAALAKLPPDAQEALRMRYGQGLPSKEIAEHLGKSDGATRVLLTRTLDKLQALMGEDDAPHR